MADDDFQNVFGWPKSAEVAPSSLDVTKAYVREGDELCNRAVAKNFWSLHLSAAMSTWGNLRLP